MSVVFFLVQILDEVFMESVKFAFGLHLWRIFFYIRGEGGMK